MERLSHTLTPEPEKIASFLGKELKQNSVVCIHPDGDTSHQWPASQYAWIARKLASKGYATVLTGVLGKCQILEEIRLMIEGQPIPIFIDHTDEDSLGWIIKQSSLLVSNNRALTQTAKTLEVPSVLITNDFTSQQSDIHIVLSEQAAVNLNTVVTTITNLIDDL